MKRLIVGLVALVMLCSASYACHMCYTPFSALESGKQHVCAGCYTCFYASNNPYLAKAMKVNSCENTECGGCYTCFSVSGVDINSHLGSLTISTTVF